MTISGKALSFFIIIYSAAYFIGHERAVHGGLLLIAGLWLIKCENDADRKRT